MTRLSFPYFMSREAVEYIIQAVTMVAKHGWKLLPQYVMDPETGSFSHKDSKAHQGNINLRSISYATGRMIHNDESLLTASPQPATLKVGNGCLRFSGSYILHPTTGSTGGSSVGL